MLVGITIVETEGSLAGRGVDVGVAVGVRDVGVAVGVVDVGVAVGVRDVGVAVGGNDVGVAVGVSGRWGCRWCQ